MGTSIPGGLDFRHTSIRVWRESSRWGKADTKWRTGRRDNIGQTDDCVTSVLVNMSKKIMLLQQTSENNEKYILTDRLHYLPVVTKENEINLIQIIVMLHHM